jgi:glycosyltransferase involved in cell wall biosynthesis
VPRRILLVITDLEIGGTPTVVRELALRLRDEVTHVQVASLKGLGPNGAILRENEIQVTPLNARHAWAFSFVMRRLRRLIRNERIDTVVGFLVHANAIASLAVPSGVRLFQSIQTTQPKPAWHWRVQRHAARRAERILVPSTSIVAAAAARSSIPVDKFIVIPNAVDPDSFTRSAVPDDPPDPYPVGFIGRLDPVKRIPDLINAAGALGKRVALHIYGEGSERSRIERWMEATSAVSVTLHGAVPRPQDVLRNLGLLVLPSEAEGFGLVLIEAMAAGVPVVATDAPGIRDVVQHESNGLLVPVGDPAALAAAIERVIDDAELRQRLIEEGLRTVRERYAWTRILPQYRAALNLDQS